MTPIGDLNRENLPYFSSDFRIKRFKYLFPLPYAKIPGEEKKKKERKRRKHIFVLNCFYFLLLSFTFLYFFFLFEGFYFHISDLQQQPFCLQIQFDVKFQLRQRQAYLLFPFMFQISCIKLSKKTFKKYTMNLQQRYTDK